MIVTVGNTKGGVGKTTLAVNIAIARALSGRDVWLIDADRQGTAQTAISIRADAGHAPGIACASYPDGPTLRAQVTQQQGKFQDIIIDAGGRDSTALRAALVLSEPGGFDDAAFREFLSTQSDLGPKQWPAHVRIAAELPRTETFKILKRRLSAEGTDCADPVYAIPRR